MVMKKRIKHARRAVAAVAIIVGLLIFIYPLTIVLLNAVKPIGEILADPLRLPAHLQLENFLRAWETASIGKLLKNSAVLTVFSVGGLVILSSMSAYWCCRYVNPVTKLLTNLLMVSMLIPFASLMIPLVKVTNVLRMNNTMYGAVIIFWGIGLAFGFFIMQSSVKLIPKELEEAAAIDGCGPIRTFFCIVFPLIKNAAFSLMAMDIFWVWNEFMIPQTMLNSSRYDTVQVGINKLFGMYSSKWDIALAALVITMIPPMITFLVLQKQILNSVLEGSTKG